MINISNIGNLNVFIITDMHLNHDKMSRNFGRPENYQTKILKSLSNIPKKSLLVDMGDITFSTSKENLTEILSKCPANKILVRGNHDNKSYGYYYDCGYSFICEQFYWPGILFSHVPVDKQYWPEDCQYNLHGHLHTNHRDYGKFGICNKDDNHLLFSLEVFGYRTFHLNELLKKFDISYIKPKEIKRIYQVFNELYPDKVLFESSILKEAKMKARDFEKLTSEKHYYSYVNI